MRKQERKPDKPTRRRRVARWAIRVDEVWLHDLRLASEITGRDQSELIRTAIHRMYIDLSEQYPGLKKLNCLRG